MYGPVNGARSHCLSQNATSKGRAKGKGKGKGRRKGNYKGKGRQNQNYQINKPAQAEPDWREKTGLDFHACEGYYS